ncbi:MAG: hypothetical protein WCJ72_12075, partial [Chryseobacterium sp.]
MKFVKNTIANITKMQRMFSGRVERMGLPNSQLEKKYGLVNSPGEKLEIHASQQKENENEILLTFSFLKKHKLIDILVLPVEVNDIIASYCEEFITMKISILHPPDYPFVPPVWHLLHVQHNVTSPLNFQEYY